MSVVVKVPTLGESIAEAIIGEWLKQPGESVAADEPIASLETDKVAVEVLAPTAGVMGAQSAAAGDAVAVGAVIAVIETGQSGNAGKISKAQTQTEPLASAAAGDAAAVATLTPPTLSPTVRRIVLEHGLDPSKIKGTGKDGRLTKGDVLAAAPGGAVADAKKDTLPAGEAARNARNARDARGGNAARVMPVSAPVSVATENLAVDSPTTARASARREERVRMTRMRQTIAKRLKSAQDTAAMLTTFNDVDMSAVIEARTNYKDLFAKKHDVRLGFMGFFTKAACLALRDIPAVNGRIDGEEIVYHDYVDVSIAVSGPKGLVVPVIRNAEALSFAAIEKAIGAFGKRAREATLTMADMTGGTFTISNGGVFGSLMSTPIINPPQSAVLGLHRIEDRPIAIKGEVVIRPMMYLALSYDHRLIDGREAVAFLKIIKNAIEDPLRLLVDL